MTTNGSIGGSAGKIRRVALKNYRSIPACDIELGALTFLVGPNGAGKSNFVDALRFVADALNATLDNAIRDRGGINQVRRRSGGHPTHFGVRLDLLLPDDTPARYAFEIATLKDNQYEVRREVCIVFGPTATKSYTIEQGSVAQPDESSPAQSDRLHLVRASSSPIFRPVFDLLRTTGFYNLNPAHIRDLQTPDPGQLLYREGDNLASVLGRLARDDPGTKTRIEQYLAEIAPGVVGMDRQVVGPKETIEFRQRVTGSNAPWRFSSLNMSDGTLRAAGILVALFQPGGPLVAIEEPETALHPAAAAVLYDALREASDSRQVLVTSHSPELLDHEGVGADDIRGVQAVDGATVIGPVTDADRKVLADRLYTAGDLLRQGALEPAPPDHHQLDLFAPA